MTQRPPKEDGLVCEGGSRGVAVQQLLPARCGEAVVAQTSLSRHGDDGGRVLAAATAAASGVLGEAAGDLRGGRFLRGDADRCGARHRRECESEGLRWMKLKERLVYLPERAARRTRPRWRGW